MFCFVFAMAVIFDFSLCKILHQNEIMHTIPNPTPLVSLGRPGPETDVDMWRTPWGLRKQRQMRVTRRQRFARRY